MRSLVDSQALIWALTDDPRLSRTALKTLSDPQVERFLSAVSLWEIGIKVALGKLKLPFPLDEVLEALPEKGLQLTQLAVDWRHAIEAARLPQHHKDPFDRMLIAQARVEGMSVLTADKAFKAYKVKIVW